MWSSPRRDWSVAGVPTPASTPLVRGSGTNYMERIDSGEPYGSLISGQQPLVWASARLVFDSPDKRSIEQGAERGRLMSRAVEQEIGAARKESLIVSPYFAPSDAELSLLEQARARNAAVKVLTGSLESAPSLAAQSGYDKVRVRLLRQGVKLYEVRSRLESTLEAGKHDAYRAMGTTRCMRSSMSSTGSAASSAPGTTISAHCVSTRKWVC